MATSNIIIILLFIIPGVLAEKVSHAVDIPSDKKTREYSELVNGILLSFPVLFLSGAIVYFVKGFTKLSDFLSELNYSLFTFKLIVLVTASAILIGILKGLLKNPLIRCINFLREVLLKKIEIDSKCCWRKMFLDEPDSHYVEIEKGGEKYSGFTRWYSLPNEEKEIVLYDPDELYDYPEYKNYFKRVKQTYVNIEKNIVIKDYDMTEYNAFVDKLRSRSEDQ